MLKEMGMSEEDVAQMLELSEDDVLILNDEFSEDDDEEE
jgi:DNA-directed RNA polymerase sigma subunit (sigma70/sigma32)